MDRQQEFVLRTLEERGHPLRAALVYRRAGISEVGGDRARRVGGRLHRGDRLRRLGDRGLRPGSYESDMVANPDPSTFQVLPWETTEGQHYSARMFCDITMPDGSPSWADPRHVLRRALSRAAEAGFTCYVHPEIEFYLLKNLPTAAPRRRRRTRAASSTRPATTRRRTSGATRIETLESMGISVEFQPHEGAPGPAGDRPALRRRAAMRRQHHDLPLRGQGSGHDAGGAGLVHAQAVHPVPGVGDAHPLQPLRGRRATPSTTPSDPYELSDTGKAFVAGVLRHAREITAVTNQWVNSYKRLVVGGEAPTTVMLGPREPVRAGPGVPMYSPGKASSRGAWRSAPWTVPATRTWPSRSSWAPG